MDLINELTPFQKVILNRHFEYLISKLSVRTHNGLAKISATYDMKEIFEMIFGDNFKFKNIPSIGNGSLEELDKFKSELIRFIAFLQKNEKEQLSKEYAKLILKTTFVNLPDNFNEQYENAFNENGKIKLFTLLKLLIDSGQLLAKNEQQPFLLSYTNVDSNLTLDTIVTISKERVRQIKTNLQSEIRNYFLFISNFNPDDLIDYGISIYNTFQIIDDSFARKINENEKVNFNKIFYSIIFEILFKKTHSVLGDKKVLQGERKTNNRRYFQNYYLINSLFNGYFDFEKFIEDFYSKLNEPIEETYSLHFQGYLFSFLKEGIKTITDELLYICETILFLELEVVPNSEGYIEFERSKQKQIHEYCFEILEENSKPMTLEEIIKVFELKYPDINVSEQSIRGNLLREKDIFISFSRTSTYGLRKWEEEKENIKGGSIRDIVEEYLNNEDEPKHISEICVYVQKFRPTTNEKSLRTSIKVDENRHFSFYAGNFIGLKDKKYNNKIKEYKNLVGFYFNKTYFYKFNGWGIDNIVNYFVEQFDYNSIQVKSIINNKIENGELKITIDNKIYL